jgi:hypothetical protein
MNREGRALTAQGVLLALSSFLVASAFANLDGDGSKEDTTKGGPLAIGSGPAPALADDPFPKELVDFAPDPKEPVFTGAGPGHWDVRIRERGWIMREGGLYRMWYTGFERDSSPVLKLGYATSSDGVKWTRHDKNPAYGDHWVEDMMVVRHEGTYYMFAEGKGDLAQLLTSEDGIAWERVGQLDVRNKNGTPIEPGP